MWKAVYFGIYDEQGESRFPQKLSKETLEGFKRAQGSYVFANQYLNEIIPAELQTFKKEWFKYYSQLPKRKNTFIFIDPALSEADTSDYTGIVVVRTDAKNDWYVEYARRHRLSPTELVQFVFELHTQYQPQVIGIEEVAYQKALLYFLSEEMRRRKQIMPITGIKYPPTKSKQQRILSLVPRFEWNHIFLNQGLTDLELELLQFPRGSHDDLIDALAGIELIAFPADDKEEEIKKPHSPNDPNYERWYIQNMHKRRNEQ